MDLYRDTWDRVEFLVSGYPRNKYKSAELERRDKIYQRLLLLIRIISLSVLQGREVSVPTSLQNQTFIGYGDFIK